MTYQCGIGPGMEAFGLRPDVPHIRCDVCGLRLDAMTRAGNAAAWLRNGTAPKGWAVVRNEGAGTRQDFCPRHRAGEHKGDVGRTNEGKGNG